MALDAGVAALLAQEGFEVEALYGWFDRSPWAGGEDSIWVCRLRRRTGLGVRNLVRKS